VAAWIVAESLDRLLQQLNALAPHRSKASDGGIGDELHATRDSDHNPWLVLSGQRIVTARDFTHHPAGGLDCAQLRDSLIRARDSRIKYIIFNRQIISGAGGPQPWVRRPYTGSNPHTKHLHLSVVADRRCRDAGPWMLPGMGAVTPAPAPPLGEYCRLRDRNDRVLKLQHFMTAVFSSYNLYRPTGYYGIATKDGVAEFQRRTGITGLDANGEVVGPRTLRELVKFGFVP
jgi:hypothetical protein